MIHERLIDNNLVEINRWNLDSYYFSPSYYEKTPIRELNLFLIQNDKGEFDSVYNYKENKFIIKKGPWNKIEYLEKYNSFIGLFEVSSDIDENDTYKFESPVTDALLVESFGVTERYYYGILDIDGTIKGNRLFKGESLSTITSIIDLSEYESLDDFKNQRREICNNEKEKKKIRFNELLNGNKSPYLDQEVLKILNLKKDN